MLMRLIITCFTIVICNAVSAQQQLDKINPPVIPGNLGVNKPPQNTPAPNEPHPLIMRCPATINPSPDPLIILDGLLIEYSQLDKLDPNNIDSIMILKNAPATAIYGCRGRNGVILIFSRKKTAEKFLISDKEDDAPIRSATIFFNPVKTNLQSFTFPASTDGELLTNQLQRGEAYEIEVNSPGYQSYRAPYISNDSARVHTLLLEKMPEQKSLQLFPNPAMNGAVVIIDRNESGEEITAIRVMTMDGKLLLARALSDAERKEKLSFVIPAEWHPGTYLLQLTGKSGNTIQTGQLIIH